MSKKPLKMVSKWAIYYIVRVFGQDDYSGCKPIMNAYKHYHNLNTDLSSLSPFSNDISVLAQTVRVLRFSLDARNVG